MFKRKQTIYPFQSAEGEKKKKKENRNFKKKKATRKYRKHKTVQPSKITSVF